MLAQKRLAWLSVLVIMTLMTAVGCGGGGQSAQPSGASSQALETLPAQIKQAYQDFDGPTDASPYATFQPKKSPPWTIGYASSYAGNTWRSGSLNQLQQVLVPAYQKAGLVDKMIVTQSNLNDSTQIQQIHQLVTQGADIILLCCSSPAIKSAVKFAQDRGVPVVTFSGYTPAEGSVNLYGNYVQGGFAMADFVAKQMGGKGNMLVVNGIPGQASNDSVDRGIQAALQNYPDIKVIGTVAGQWTDQIAKTEVLKFLSTHPEKIDGVVTHSAQEIGVLQAILESGRPLPPMTIGGEKGAACYWLNHPEWKTRLFNVWPPASEATGAMSVMIRILQGQGPKIQSITRELSEYGIDDIRQIMPADCDVNDASWIEPDGWFTEDYLNNFFLRPSAPLGHDAPVPSAQGGGK
jgi:ribose transport system substrate-binding protein